ncbi:GlcG/HbpS family heme-binding protein [Parasphingopyxis algicola]|uniref:GlcG/HbpS family heme-binding protein n=1 Tax=Parasphingopyxis algicola TaxID=2026624 RepID=UPI001C40B0A2|nr:heme-binding protein [Parasphingopyxis algicola]
MKEITMEQAMAALRAGLAKASDLNEPSCMAVVDAGGNLMAFARSDGAMHGTIELAINKAFTASAFGIPTADLGADVQPGGEIFGLESIRTRGSFVAFGGGLPIVENDLCIGAVGVSGGPVSVDNEIAAAMRAAICR